MSPELISLGLGLVVGLLLGALGGAGGVLAVPVLVYVLHVDAHLAVTASLVIVGTAALIAALRHARSGTVRWAHGLAFGVLGAAGSWAGTRLSEGIDADVLLLAFAGLMLVTAAAMVRRVLHPPAAPARSTSHRVAADRRSRSCSTGLKIVVAATVVGALSGFFGVGGGFVVVPALVLVFGFGMEQAIGTSLLVIAINSAFSLASRLPELPRLPLDIVLPFTAAAIAGSLLGAAIAAHVPGRKLAIGFVALLLVLAIYVGARSLTSLLG